MNWQLKAITLAALSCMPGGTRLYHRLQKLAGSNSLDFNESLARAAEIIGLVREVNGTFQDTICVEIGSGWRPFLPFIVFLDGASEIHSFDVNPWMDQRYVDETYEAIAERLPQIAECLNKPLSEICTRFPRRNQESTVDFRQTIAQFEMRYHCPGDARKTGLANESVDIAFSSNVLEHIPPAVLQEIHAEMWRVLRPDGLAVHRFNPQDHFSTVDKSINGANFLRYSEQQWKWIGGFGLAYHNRLRCVQHAAILQDAGFELPVCRTRQDSRALVALNSGTQPVHDDFKAFTPEALAEDYMWVVARKGIH